jgi:hypothetical protein
VSGEASFIIGENLAVDGGCIARVGPGPPFRAGQVFLSPRPTFARQQLLAESGANRIRYPVAQQPYVFTFG